MREKIEACYVEKLLKHRQTENTFCHEDDVKNYLDMLMMNSGII